MSRKIRNKIRQALESEPRVALLVRRNIRLARRNWEVSAAQAATLKCLTEELQLSIAVGDLMILDTKWYVTHAGLLRVARRNQCSGIRVHPIREFSAPSTG